MAPPFLLCGFTRAFNSRLRPSPRLPLAVAACVPASLPPQSHLFSSCASASAASSSLSSNGSNARTNSPNNFFLSSVAASAVAFGLGISIFASPSTDSASGSPLGAPHSDAGQPLPNLYNVPRAVPSPYPSSLPQSGTMASPGITGGPVITRSGHIITKLKVFVGYDPREDLAYEVCRHSLLKHATIPVEIIPIKQADLRKLGLYVRNRDPTESTEFSFTRFLTPYLAGYDGWAMFVDCDFVYTADIRELVEMLDDRYAVMCVQHDYTPKTASKMDGVVQTTYPRKNWSSMVLYNCSHPKNRVLTPAVVNCQSGAFLHRFMWLDDKDIGAIPFTWNFLVGHNELSKGDGKGPQILPKAIHYTSGGPWFEAWRNCDYADIWFQERDEYRRTHMIQKVIQDELIKLLDSRMAEKATQLEERVAALEGRLKEVAALQRLLLVYLQDRPLLGPERNGKEAPLKAEQFHLEDRVLRATVDFGKEP